MEGRIETPTRERWADVLARHELEQETEYRRDDPRRIVEYATVRVIFKEWDSWVARSGTILNASVGGLMAMVKERVPSASKVQLEVTIADEVFALSGRVAHCTQTVGGFKVGFRLQFAEEAEPRPPVANPMAKPVMVPARETETARVRRLIRQRRF